MISITVKTRDDIPKAIRAARRGNIDSLGKAGAFTRGVMKRTIGRAKNPRPEGQPMASATGRARGAVLFAVEAERGRVLIGPTHKRAGQWAAAHEHGLKYKGQRFAARPFAAPTLPKVDHKIAEFWRGFIAR